MSESDNARRRVGQAVQELHEINVGLKNYNDFLISDLRAKENEIEFHKQQAEFWAGECIAEQRKAHISNMIMFIVSAMAFVAIGKAILSCQ